MEDVPYDGSQWCLSDVTDLQWDPSGYSCDHRFSGKNSAACCAIIAVKCDRSANNVASEDIGILNQENVNFLEVLKGNGESIRV